MASYRYTVTIQEPRLLSIDPVPTPVITELGCAAHATQWAHAQYARPGGTSIVISRRRLVRDRIAGRSTVGPTGPELAYRRYVAQGGIVKRVEE